MEYTIIDTPTTSSRQSNKITKVRTIELLGLEGITVDVEVHTNLGHGRFSIIGLPDASLLDAVYRVSTALKTTEYGFQYNRCVTVNLAPADLAKDGPSYDMPIAIAVLLAQEKQELDLSDSIFVGELSLDGQFRAVRGVLAIVDAAKNLGYQKIYIPAVHAHEVGIVHGIDIYCVETIGQLYEHIAHGTALPRVEPRECPQQIYDSEFDLAFIRGQAQAKRALEVALAGGHNILLAGPPGSGKTLLAKTAVSLLPTIQHNEAIEIAKLHSLVSLDMQATLKIFTRPYRNPHHSASLASLIGGGRIPRPGEVSLAHRGVLFLDELPEFPRSVLEALRQPLEDGYVNIARVSSTISFPCRALVIGAYNPCPCGYYGDPQRSCSCTDFVRTRYMSKLSGPLLDRFDIHLRVPRISFEEMRDEKGLGETSESVRARIDGARAIALERFMGTHITTNAEMSARHIKKFCVLDGDAEALLSQAANRYLLSGRAISRVLKISRTIADLAGSVDVKQEHLLEALSYKVGI